MFSAPNCSYVWDSKRDTHFHPCKALPMFMGSLCLLLFSMQNLVIGGRERVQSI